MISPVWFEPESRLLCGSIGMFFVCLMPVIRFSRNVLRAVLSKCLAFVLRLSYVPIGMSYVRSRLLFAACAPNRTACDMFRSCSAVGRDRHSCVLGCRVVIRLCWFTSGLRVSLWRSRRRTKGRGNAGDGERSRRRGRARFCVIILALPCFPRGVRWGLRAPKPAPKSLRLSGLSSFDSRCGGVSRGEGRSSATRT